ncbi:MAG: MaoC family dehydratase N-terminal domain-containing protein [bacterium]|nr:MaoC family dehydratase N-terminal domain-containing protein [bacterium]
METLEELVGRSYGPIRFRVEETRVKAFVAATGDDPERWQSHAPPSFAAAALFKAAPAFLYDPQVLPHARFLLHGEQAFSWYRPWSVGDSLTISARVEKLRGRGGTSFVTFGAEVWDAEQQPVLSSRSLFLMYAEAPPVDPVEERSEPEAEAGSVKTPPRSQPPPAAGEALPPLEKSASRLDLVRYAAASEDFNPIHWDHRRGVDSGVGGVICHGLLMAAWATQPAAALVNRPDPLDKARFRFRLPLYPDRIARVETVGKGQDQGKISLVSTVLSDAGEHVRASIQAKSRERG